MKYVSLFAGIGGFDLALNRLGHICVYANDFDKYCKITYDKNFENKLDTTPIQNVPTSTIPDYDLLVGGFPCQSFSIAGKRRGFEDTRGTLFFDIARILSDKRPRYFILENVKGLLSHDGGKTFQTILGILTSLGYEYQWQILNSKNFGVPQNRERVFIVGYLRGKPRPKVFPIGEDAQLSSQRQGKISPTITSRYYKQRQSDPYIVVEKPNTGKQSLQQDGNKSDNSNSGGGKAYSPIIRRLTPLECERLQGFPDGWTEGVSDTQRYKQLGNAVTVNVVEAIVERLFPNYVRRTKRT